MKNLRIDASYLVFALAPLITTGCLSTEEGLVVGAAGLTAFGAQSPSHEVQQTYYLGIFDPQEQLEPTVYRVRLIGQASMLNRVNFASGWLPAQAVDNLGTKVEIDKKTGRVSVHPNAHGGTGGDEGGFETGRRLIIFGPEGFRESPGNHRLVIAMGSNPDEYFRMVSEAMAVVADVTQTPEDTEARSQLQQEILTKLRAISLDQDKTRKLAERSDRTLSGKDAQ